MVFKRIIKRHYKNVCHSFNGIFNLWGNGQQQSYQQTAQYIFFINDISQVNLEGCLVGFVGTSILRPPTSELKLHGNVLWGTDSAQGVEGGQQGAGWIQLSPVSFKHILLLYNLLAGKYSGNFKYYSSCIENRTITRVPIN